MNQNPEEKKTKAGAGKKAYIIERGRDEKTGIVYDRAIREIEQPPEDNITPLKEALRTLSKELKKTGESVTEAAKAAAGDTSGINAALEQIKKTISPAMKQITALTSEAKASEEFKKAAEAAEAELNFREKELKKKFYKEAFWKYNKKKHEKLLEQASPEELEEFRKKYYKAPSWVDIMQEHREAIQTASETEIAMSLWDDGSVIISGTMYEHYIRARNADILRRKEASTIKLREPMGLIMPMDKVTSKIGNEKNPENKEVIEGSVFLSSRAERTAGKEIKTIYTIRKHNQEIALSISKKDLFMIMMLDGIYTTAIADGIDKSEVKATPYDLAKLIYNVERPGKHYINDLLASVYKNRSISVYIDNSEAAEERGKETIPEAFYLLPVEITKEGKIHILKRPVIVEEWILQVMGEYTTIPPDILRVPSVNLTDDNCAIIFELLRSILGKFTSKNAATGEKEIPFSLLWENCGIAGKTQSEMNQRTRLRKNTIIPCLEYWSAGNYLYRTEKERAEIRNQKPDKKNIYLSEAARIIDGYRIERNCIYITPKSKNITEGKKRPSKK